MATYLSELLNPGLSNGVYYSFDNHGDEWIGFCRDNVQEIKATLSEDLEHWTMNEEVEWFRLRGGNKYGFKRLGYYIGTEFIRNHVNSFGLSETITLWANGDIKPVIKEWIMTTLVNGDKHA